MSSFGLTAIGSKEWGNKDCGAYYWTSANDSNHLKSCQPWVDSHPRLSKAGSNTLSDRVLAV